MAWCRHLVSNTLDTFTRDKDPVEFSAAACNLGLLGVIYSYTLHVEPMFNLSVVGRFRARVLWTTLTVQNKEVPG
ncbi:hypothetical protein BGX30_001065 [Mortierella sp. GBA39]|nr:hypothetical protein BGX30_001065 [Mortierella sp. GBA39]